MPPARLLRSPTLRALRVPNYRRWFFGGLVSTTGTWMQLVAQNWVVLQLSGSTSALGASVSLQALPAATLGLWGGVLADRVSRRRLLMVTQSVNGVLAALLGLLVLTGSLQLWMLLVFSLLSGLVVCVDGPAGAAFGAELVDDDDLPNAIALGSAASAMGRVAGMAAAGVVLAVAGAASVFLLNAVSYAGVLVALATMDTSSLRTAPPSPATGGQLRAGLRYVASRRPLLITMVLAFFLASFGRNFQVTMAAMTDGPLGSGAAGYGASSTVFAVGAFAGALLAARLRRITRPMLIGAALVAGTAQILAGMAPGMTSFLVVLFPVAVHAVVIDTALATQVQLGTDGNLRARVAAILALAGGAGSAVGGPLLGWLAESLGARASLVIGGGVASAAALAAAAAFAAYSGREAFRERLLGLRVPVLGSLRLSTLR